MASQSLVSQHGQDAPDPATHGDGDGDGDDDEVPSCLAFYIDAIDSSFEYSDPICFVLVFASYKMCRTSG